MLNGWILNPNFFSVKSSLIQTDDLTIIIYKQ